MCKGETGQSHIVNSVFEDVRKMVLTIKPDLSDVGPLKMLGCHIRLDEKNVVVLADSGSPNTMIGEKNWEREFGGGEITLFPPDINLVAMWGGQNRCSGLCCHEDHL